MGGGCCPYICIGAYADPGSNVIVGRLPGVSSGNGASFAAATVAPAGALGTSVEDDSLRLRRRPRIDGDAPFVMLIFWRSRVGVVSGTGDFARRLPGVVKEGGTDNGDDLVD